MTCNFVLLSNPPLPDVSLPFAGPRRGQCGSRNQLYVGPEHVSVLSSPKHEEFAGLAGGAKIAELFPQHTSVDRCSREASGIVRVRSSRVGSTPQVLTVAVRVSGMEHSSEDDQRHVDRGKVMGEPRRQIDSDDRAMLRAEALGDLG